MSLLNTTLPPPAPGLHWAAVGTAITTTVTDWVANRSPTSQCSTLPTIGLHVPFVVEENDHVTGPGNVSSIVTLLAVPGPLFVSTIVKVIVSPALTVPPTSAA